MTPDSAKALTPAERLKKAKEATLSSELEELARAIVEFHKQHGSVLAVHIDNLGDLLEELDAARAPSAKQETPHV